MVDGKWVRQQIDQSNSAARHWFASRARSARASSALRQWFRFEALFEGRLRRFSILRVLFPYAHWFKTFGISKSFIYGVSIFSGFWSFLGVFWSKKKGPILRV